MPHSISRLSPDDKVHTPTYPTLAFRFPSLLSLVINIFILFFLPSHLQICLFISPLCLFIHVKCLTFYPCLHFPLSVIINTLHAPSFVLPVTLMCIQVEETNIANAKPFIWPEKLGVDYTCFGIPGEKKKQEDISTLVCVLYYRWITCMNLLRVCSMAVASLQQSANHISCLIFSGLNEPIRVQQSPLETSGVYGDRWGSSAPERRINQDRWQHLIGAH